MAFLRTRKSINYKHLHEGDTFSHERIVKQTPEHVLPDLYDVQRLIWKRNAPHGHGFQYLVKWQNYHVTESTWEPESHIPDQIARKYTNPEISETRKEVFTTTLERAAHLRLRSTNPSSVLFVDLDIYRAYFGEDTRLCSFEDFTCLNLPEHWYYRINKDGIGKRLKFPVKLVPKLHMRNVFSYSNGKVVKKSVPVEKCIMYSVTEACSFSDL